MRLVRVRDILLVAVAGLLTCTLVGCGGSLPGAAATPTVEQSDGQQATCQAAKDPLNPLIVEWPGTSKVDLDAASGRGLVVVSYAGCVLKVLAQCATGGAYQAKSVTPVRDKVVMENESDLFARLPLGVASLKGELKAAQRLELDYVAVGQRVASAPPAMLQGECRGVTHYVRTIMVGAYRLDALGRASAGAAVDVADRGAGASHREAVRRLRGAGDVEACASGAPAENGASAGACDAILQLGLAPLGVGEGGRVASAGFGEGLGPLAVVPTLPRLGGEPVEAASLAEVDLELLEKLQAAKRREKEQGATPAERAAGWDAVARHERENPYREQAAARRDEWTAVAQAQEKYREQVGQVCAKHARDVDRLAKLLALDDDVVPARQKQAYRAEMQQVYEPWAKELSACRAGGGEPDMALLAPASRRPESERPSRPATAAPDFEGEPSGEPSGDARWTAGWWVGGLGVAALGAGVVMGAVAKAQYDEASEPCPDGVCRTTADQDSAMAGRDDARTLGTAGTVVGIAGSVVGALGLTLVLTGDSSPPRAPREARVVGTVGAAGAWIGIAGEL